MRPLRIVRTEQLGPADVLAIVVPDLAEAEAVVVRLRAIMAEQGRRLASERGVTFIREEHLRREFGR